MAVSYASTRLFSNTPDFPNGGPCALTSTGDCKPKVPDLAPQKFRQTQKRRNTTDRQNTTGSYLQEGLGDLGWSRNPGRAPNVRSLKWGEPHEIGRPPYSSLGIKRRPKNQPKTVSLQSHEVFIGVPVYWDRFITAQGQRSIPRIWRKEYLKPKKSQKGEGLGEVR